MKKIIITIVVLSFFVFGCSFIDTVVGSGNLIEMQMSYSGFTRLDVDAPFEVTLIQDAEYGVTIMSDDNIIEYIEVSKSGDTLSLDLAPFFSFSNVSLKAVITMPVLEGLALSSASTVTVIDSASFPGVTDFDATVSDASQLLISSLVANTLSVTVSNASRATIGAIASTTFVAIDDAASLQLNGSSFDLNLDVSDASDADLADFDVSSASVSVRNASEGWITVDGVLDADITGASTLYYKGTVTLGYLNIEGASSFAVY